MRRRAGFTLIEMMVSVALILFIMYILTDAFGKGLATFQQLKAMGDMEARLRTTAATLRRDLEADHFEGKRRLSDPAGRWNVMERPREGFFRHAARSGPGWPAFVAEGADSEGFNSYRVVSSILHFTVKLRGNDRSNFFNAKVPPNSPLLGLRTTFFDLPKDARFQDPVGDIYSSQWAEVAYWLQPNGNVNGNIPLYTLYRSQFVIVADNSKLNWPTFAVKITDPSSTAYDEISCRPAGPGQPEIYINNPTDINQPYAPGIHRRAFNPTAPTLRAATPLLTDVVSFGVWTGDFDGNGVPVRFPLKDTHTLTNDPSNTVTFVGDVLRIAVTIRGQDPKSKQSRQITVVQDL